MTDTTNAIPGSTPVNQYSNPPGAGAQDVVTQLRGVVQQLSSWVAVGQREGSFTIGTVTAVNNLGTASIQIIAADSARTYIVFHNPSNTVELLVCQSPTVASFTTRGGSFLILPGDYLTLTGAVSVAWNGIAQSGANNPLTIITSTQ
jgi:hypothetical protein